MARPSQGPSAGTGGSRAAPVALLAKARDNPPVTSAPLWVLLVVALFGVAGSVTGTVLGVLLTQRRSGEVRVSGGAQRAIALLQLPDPGPGVAGAAFRWTGRRRHGTAHAVRPRRA
jgi:hypothetical protein